MKLTVLGAGSSIQYENRASASFLIETDGRKLLLDAGFCLLDRLEKAGVLADQIDSVYISHKHPDHFMGLIHLLFALKNRYYSPKNELVIFGFKGLAEWLDSFRDILGHWIEPDMKITVKEDRKGETGDISWELFPTVHSDESTGIIIRNANNKITYTGDTEFFEELSYYAKDSDLLIAECGSGNNEKIRGHMCLDDVRKTAVKASAERVLLTHIYPETDITPEKWTEDGITFMRSCDLYKISL